MPTLESHLESQYIEVYEPFAEFLGASPAEVHFKIRLLDVVRLSGHLCRSMTSAFLLTKHAAPLLFPDAPLTRGNVTVRLAGTGPKGAQGPMSQVFGYLSGAWGESGFGGLGGEQFVRKNLLSYSPEIPEGQYEFKNNVSGKTLRLKMRMEELPPGDSNKPFQEVWREQILFMIENASKVVETI